MKTFQTKQISTYEFIQLRRYCEKAEIAYEVVDAFTNGNKILVNLFITRTEDEVYTKIKWDAHDVSKFADYTLSSDC